MIATDKIYHFIAGFVITLVMGLFTTLLIGLAVGTLAGVLKEAYDEYDYQGADVMDFIATLAGVFVAGGVLVGVSLWG